MVIEMPLRTYSAANLREHWSVRARRVRAERRTTFWTLKAAGFKPHLPARITLCRISSGMLDDDNLRSAFKAIRDEIALAYKIPDNDPRLIWDYAQQSCKRGTYSVRITLE